MDITAIERLIRLFVAPAALAICPMIGIAVLPNPAKLSPMLAGMAQIFVSMNLILALVSSAGLAWVVWRCWILWKWESGQRDGGCYSCAGPMHHKNGRYGPYSVCLMCGSKREGHH